MKKLLFVMNPYAGMRRANRFLTDILSLFNGRGYEVTVHMTAGPGDGARAVEAMAGRADLVVCAGGDGTFNETVAFCAADWTCLWAIFPAAAPTTLPIP